MYASLVIGIGVPGKYEEIAADVAKNAAKRYEGTKGFKSAVYFSDKERNEYGLIEIWESKADLEAYRKSIPAALAKYVKSVTAGMLFEQRTFYVNEFFSADKPASKK